MKSKLSSLCDYVTGKTSVAALTKKTYISTENMLVERAGITESSALPLIATTQKYSKSDILVSNIRPYFKKIWQAEWDGGCSNDVLVFRAKSGCDPKFLYYVLADDGFFAYSTKTSKGTKMPRGDRKAIMDYPVPDLDSDSQRKIASILSSLDEKIIINRRINDNLLEQAQTLFKSWFVDFEPFDEQYCITPAGTKAPPSLLMSRIADIPHILETGRRPKGGAVTEGIPSVGAENVKEIGSVNFASTKYIPKDFAASLKSGEVHGYELMLYKDGGKPGTFIPHFSMFGEGFPFDKFYINEHVFKLDFFVPGYNEFAYFYLQTDYPYHWLANNGGKAAVPGINQQDVNSIWIFTPENSKVQEFCAWVRPLFRTILTNCAQNVKLSKLRDELLPRLMSGELDVSDIKAEL
ncbi:MAG: restriction endonuclease subunit S [Clostridia bacterium]|nr:restriction endonuclease subunit S [Clostridia bacterium]